MQDNTKAFFGESIGNPKGDLLDIEAVAGVAHRNGVPLIVDNTIATPFLIRAGSRLAPPVMGVNRQPVNFEYVRFG